MDEATIRAALRRHWADMTTQEDADDFYDEDVVLEFPQSGERIRGVANVRGMRDAYPGHVSLDVRRVRGSGPIWVSEHVVTYDGTRQMHAVNIMEFEDGKVVREAIHFGDPWDPPAWRARWVEPVASATAAEWAPPDAARSGEHATDDDGLEAAIDRTHAAIAAFVNGDAAAWTAQCSRRADATLFGGWGGWERGWDELGPRYGWAAGRYAGGTVSFEELARHEAGDLAVIVHVERMWARLVGQDDLARITLRVTHVYGRDPKGWRLLHRHADPLVAIQDASSVLDHGVMGAALAGSPGTTSA